MLRDYIKNSLAHKKKVSRPGESTRCSAYGLRIARPACKTIAALEIRKTFI
jgi:hypothetical protein